MISADKLLAKVGTSIGEVEIDPKAVIPAGSVLFFIYLCKDDIANFFNRVLDGKFHFRFKSPLIEIEIDPKE